MTTARPMTDRPKIPRLSVRRLIVIVAVSAIFMSAVHRRGPRPGLYLSGLGYSMGVCRNESFGRLAYANGDLGTANYQSGVWGSRGDGSLVAGVEYQDGRVAFRGGPNYWIAW